MENKIQFCLDKLDISENTVAILVNSSPELISSDELEELVDALSFAVFPDKYDGLAILVGNNLGDVLSEVDESTMNLMGWYRGRR